MAAKRKKKKNYTYAVGRRKQSSARIRLFKGKKKNMVNGQPIEEYFPGEVDNVAYEKPFKITGTKAKYYATARIVGGGKNGQLGAFVHGVARALAKENEEKFREPLKRAGLLTRDARVKERRKVGTGGKARRKKQSPKR
jgi:small subunit ribosomal protein S9